MKFSEAACLLMRSRTVQLTFTRSSGRSRLVLWHVVHRVQLGFDGWDSLADVDAENQADQLKHASNGECDGQCHEENRDGHNQRDTGAASERPDTLEKCSVLAGSRHVHGIGDTCPFSGICDALGALTSRFQTNSWLRTHDPGIPRWRVTGGERIGQNFI